MYLKSLTLKGFKSFPERTRLEFSPGVSVIVGPNGSGKSNVTDAVLWALGEQSPVAVRGHSMQDVIFAGARGIQARSEAFVEVVLDNSDSTVQLPAAEISISRRLDRNGEGEYRLNGARCRLVDVMELLSDTGLGREMHSVVSQGRVESIVTSRPRDRRMLIEEAAGLGKHRRRRRRAQIKLERTQENLDRALDVEREARTRLRPLKRQAEAAELHARLDRQLDESSWRLAGDDARAAGAALAAAEVEVRRARATAAAAERDLRDVAQRRADAERALSARAAEREGVSGRFYAAQGSAERIALRSESARRAVAAIEARLQRRASVLAALEREAAADVVDADAQQRIGALEAELAELGRDRAERLAREMAQLETERLQAAAETERLAAAARDRAADVRNADAAVESGRRELREAELDVHRARRDAARVGSELAGVNHFLRMHTGAPGGARALADCLTVESGYELALAAALGSRLRAALASDLDEGCALLDRAGRDGGTALLVTDSAPSATGMPPCPGAVPLAARVVADGPETASGLLGVLLDDVWVVDDLNDVAAAFEGVAVTRAGRVWCARARELRQVPAGGEDRVLAERNRREGLLSAVEAASRSESSAALRVDRAREALAEAEALRDEAAAGARAAERARAEAEERERYLRETMRRRRDQPDDGPDATRRAQAEAALRAERRLAEQAQKERQRRERRIAVEHRRQEFERSLLPEVQRLLAAMTDAGAAVADRVESLRAELTSERATGERLAAELSRCAADETRLQSRLGEAREQVTRSEVGAQRLRDRARDAVAELSTLAERLGLAAEEPDEALSADVRAGLTDTAQRLRRRREQLGPVNPLAAQEYAEAMEHVEELERQREDLEAALRELQGLIRETDRRIREAFDQTFEAAARNFEEVAGQLFPGGRGRLRLVREDDAPRPVLGGQGAAAVDQAGSPPDEDGAEDAAGVEIEITPAGKATRRLSLLSGGEKSMTALAFLFAVFLARPCPFYILDEVEAALDDSNIDRFLALLRRVSDRAQFVVVTHQRRTMEAADCLYGVSMGGDGVSKVISRRLPPQEPRRAA